MKQNKTVLYRRMIGRIVHFYTQIDEYGSMISDSGSGYCGIIAGIQTQIDEDISILVEVFSIPRSQVMADIVSGLAERSAETIGSIINNK